MQLQYKKDFQKVLDRFEAWWDCRIIDRPLVSIRVEPRRRSELPQKNHASLRDRWMDAEYLMDRFEASVADEIFVGDCIPKYTPNLGPDLYAANYGCELQFAEDTSWSTPMAASCREILKLSPNLDNVYWNTIRRMTDLSLQRGAGKRITGLTDMHSNGDLLVAMRGPEALAMECADDIEAVAQACSHVTDYYPTIYRDLHRRLEAAGQPTCSCSPMLARDKMYMVSCDFICMISPEMFERTIRPALVREVDFLDRSLFHLDGPGALRHIDSILAIKKLNGIQWVYGAGGGPGRKWIDVYRKIQQAGKCMEVKCQDIEDATAICEHLRPEGVWLNVMGKYSLQTAQNFIDYVQRWAAGKKA